MFDDNLKDDFLKNGNNMVDENKTENEIDNVIENKIKNESEYDVTSNDNRRDLSNDDIKSFWDELKSNATNDDAYGAGS